MSIASLPFTQRTNAVPVMLAEPRECSECRNPHYWFVNRDGRTRCVACDEDFRREGPHGQ